MMEDYKINEKALTILIANPQHALGAKNTGKDDVSQRGPIRSNQPQR